ncbi:diguanylate phosphodiesterase [Vibrio albus]|uniref:Diguanylate phosphodiesterase n=1 Tax=Vibrio albus TaxID=2200953 RepID=A0A2U3B5R9_9VIBR|nr:EAL domain-containing protein [Vibrio albus]PWI32148.1 diguanylate phosphodiesterase [Vibrio albus]
MFQVEGVKSGIIVKKGSTYAELDFLVQPIVDTYGLEIRYFEVLSRVSKHSGEQLDSEDFFSDIDDEFIKLVALHQIYYFQRRNIEKPFCINLTMSSLFDEVFVCRLLNFKVKNFTIEINDVNHDVNCEVLHKNIAKLQKSGVKFWLDDYYHEYNNANLSFGLIPWDRIKVDKSVLHYNSDDRSLADSMYYVLKPFCKDGLVFEGIESAFQHNLIKNNKVLGQGYYYSYPDTLESFREKKFYLIKEKDAAY